MYSGDISTGNKSWSNSRITVIHSILPFAPDIHYRNEIMGKPQHDSEVSRLDKSPAELLTLYSELIRLTKPIGILMILHPVLTGFFFTIITTNPSSRPWSIFSTHLPWICASTFFFRSFACAWNDIVDAKPDRMVERTRMRPMARRAISVPAACTFSALLLLLAFSSMVPIASSINGLLVYRLPQTILTLLYPFGKRVSNFTQFYLGIAIADGIFTGTYLAGFDIFAHLATVTSTWNIWEIGSTARLLDALGPRTIGLGALYFSHILCVVIYDTIYAFQDVSDDKKAKLKSLAIILGKSARTSLTGLATVSICLLSYAAVALHHSQTRDKNDESLSSFSDILRESWNYCMFSVVGHSLGWFYVLSNVNFNDPKSCGFWFRQAGVWAGNSVLIGLVAQYVFMSLDD